MTSALRRGKTLDPEAVKKAKEWRKARIEELESRDILSLSRKERHELRRIRG